MKKSNIFKGLAITVFGVFVIFLFVRDVMCGGFSDINNIFGEIIGFIFGLCLSRGGINIIIVNSKSRHNGNDCNKDEDDEVHTVLFGSCK